MPPPSHSSLMKEVRYLFKRSSNGSFTHHSNFSSQQCYTFRADSILFALKEASKIIISEPTPRSVRDSSNRHLIGSEATMAGRTKDKKADPSIRSKKPAIPSPEDLSLSGGQHVVDLRGSHSRRPSQGKASQDTRQGDRVPAPSGSREREVGVQLTTATTQGSSDLLWITTDRPTDFKDAKIQKMISKHVMRDYQQKDQSGKDSGRSRRKKSSQSSQSDDDFGSLSQQSKMPIVERSVVRNS